MQPVALREIWRRNTATLHTAVYFILFSSYFAHSFVQNVHFTVSVGKTKVLVKNSDKKRAFNKTKIVKHWGSAQCGAAAASGRCRLFQTTVPSPEPHLQLVCALPTLFQFGPEQARTLIYRYALHTCAAREGASLTVAVLSLQMLQRRL